MKYILDTNTVSSLMKGEPSAVSHLLSQPKNCVFIPQPVVSEIQYGIQRLAASKNKILLQQRFDVVVGEINRVTWDDKVSEEFGRIKSELERTGRVIEDFDIAIAAHAISAKGTLVTDNVKHMRNVPGLDMTSWKA